MEFFTSGTLGASLLGVAIGLVAFGLIVAVMNLAKRGKAKEAKNPGEEVEEIPITSVRLGSLVITDFTISPFDAKEGEMVNISYKVTNTGKNRTLHTSELRINGVEIGKLSMDLAPEATELADFAVSESVAGEYKVEVEGLEGKFVIRPANLIVSSIDIDPRRVKEKEQVNVMAEVTNTGGITGTEQILVKIRDKVLFFEELSVAPGASQKVNLTLTDLEPGTHEIRIGDFRDTFAVEMLLDEIES